MKSKRRYRIQLALVVCGVSVAAGLFLVGLQKKIIPSPDARLREMLNIKSTPPPAAAPSIAVNALPEPPTPRRPEPKPESAPPVRVASAPERQPDPPAPPRPVESTQVPKNAVERSTEPQPHIPPIASLRSTTNQIATTVPPAPKTPPPQNPIPQHAVEAPAIPLSLTNLQRAAVLVEKGVAAPRMRARYSTSDIVQLVESGAGYLVAEPVGEADGKMILKGPLAKPTFIRLSGERARTMSNLGIDLVTEGALTPASEVMSHYLGTGAARLVFYPSSVLGRSILQKQHWAVLSANVKNDEVLTTDGEIVVSGNSARYVVTDISLKNGRTLKIADPEALPRSAL